jgi:hypothetical protein
VVWGSLSITGGLAPQTPIGGKRTRPRTPFARVGCVHFGLDTGVGAVVVFCDGVLVGQPQLPRFVVGRAGDLGLWLDRLCRNFLVILFANLGFSAS